MKIIITLTVPKPDRGAQRDKAKAKAKAKAEQISIDIGVTQEQIILEALKTIQQNLQLFPPDFLAEEPGSNSQKQIRLLPSGRKIPVGLSFQEAGIYTGAHLLLQK